MVTVNSCGKKESQDLEGQGDALMELLIMLQCPLALTLGLYLQLNLKTLRMKLLTLLFILILPTIVLPNDKGFAVSGGVSLGSYEAGVLYSLVAEKRDDLTRELKVVYGASAGSINGLLGIIDLCGYRISRRESNLLWKMWIPIGLDQLETKDKRITSLFDRKSIDPLFNELRERWIEGFKDSCDLQFGESF